MLIEKHCFEHVKGYLIVMKWVSMVMPETLLTTKAFYQQLRALANIVTICCAE